MSLRLRKRKAKRREEFLLNRDYELESSRVRYDADAEQRRASARDMYTGPPRGGGPGGGGAADPKACH